MIYLDIETLDFFQDEHIKALPRDQQLRSMRLGCAVTYNATSGDWLEWFGEDIADLFPYLCYGPAHPVCGWNVIDFDWPVICHNAAAKGGDALVSRSKTPEMIDLFDLIRKATGRWYKLEDVAQANLGRGKLADGQKAAEWLRSGNKELIAKAVEYCRRDVQLTVDLYEILLSDRPLRLLPRSARQELNDILFWRNGRIERIPDATGNISTR